MVDASHPRTGILPVAICVTFPCPFLEKFNAFSLTYILRTVQCLSYLTYSSSPLPRACVMLRPSFPCLKKVVRVVLHVAVHLHSAMQQMAAEGKREISVGLNR